MLGRGLVKALYNYMHGLGLEEDVRVWFEGMVPKTTVQVESENDAKKILRLVDQLEDNDDVQDVYANFDIPERVLEAVAG